MDTAMASHEPFPTEIPIFVHVAGSTPYVFYLELKGEALEAVGVLEQVTDVLAGQGVPILQVSVIASSGTVKLVVFADVRERKLVDKLVTELGKVPYAINISYSGPLVDGFAYCDRCFPITVRGQRAVLFSRQVYEGFFREGWRRFGTAFPIMLYMLGFESGRLAYQRHLEVAGGDVKAVVKVAEAFFQLLGYGRLEVLKIDDARREAVYRVYDSFECELFKGEGEVRAGFIRGLIGGWLAARWDISEAEGIVVREEKCIAKGDPYCEARVWVEKK
jgi:predicted hydrocarbon binding protein/predicted amino acid-binding ACT domain protein